MGGGHSLTTPLPPTPFFDIVLPPLYVRIIIIHCIYFRWVASLWMEKKSFSLRSYANPFFFLFGVFRFNIARAVQLLLVYGFGCRPCSYRSCYHSVGVLWKRLTIHYGATWMRRCVSCHWDDVRIW